MKTWKFDIFLLCFFIALFGYCCKQKDTYREPVIKVVHDTIRIFDTIPLEDLKVLKKLIPVLKEREGLELDTYKLNGKLYIYRGHKILKGETFNGTLQEADSIFWDDIVKSYKEVQRIERKELFNRVYSKFISSSIYLKPKVK